MHKPEMTLILSDARGQYIPRDFTNAVARERVTGVTDEDWKILEAGPDNELYWDVWADVELAARVTDDNGNAYFIWNDSDCWLVPVGMEWDDDQNTYVWPSNDPVDERTDYGVNPHLKESAND